MTYILDLANGGNMDPRDILALWTRYDEYLASIKDHLPPSAYAFAVAPWHYHTADHRSPHDAWVESLALHERARVIDRGPINVAHEEVPAEDPPARKVDIHLRLLGAYHDGHIEFVYTNVNSYSLSKPPLGPGSFGSGGWKYFNHSDWLIDEVRLSDRGLVIHEIVFASDSRWLIECEDFTYEWRPFLDSI